MSIMTSVTNRFSVHLVYPNIRHRLIQDSSFRSLCLSQIIDYGFIYSIPINVSSYNFKMRYQSFSTMKEEQCPKLGRCKIIGIKRGQSGIPAYSSCCRTFNYCLEIVFQVIALDLEAVRYSHIWEIYVIRNVASSGNRRFHLALPLQSSTLACSRALYSPYT